MRPKQAAFIATHDPLQGGLAADEAVCFADAVHSEYQTKPALGWVKRGSSPAVKTTAGRGRVNIHGTLNLETFDAPFMALATVDGASVVQLLAKIRARNPDKHTATSSGTTPPATAGRMYGRFSRGPSAASIRSNCRPAARTSTRSSGSGPSCANTSRKTDITQPKGNARRLS